MLVLPVVDSPSPAAAAPLASFLQDHPQGPHPYELMAPGTVVVLPLAASPSPAAAALLGPLPVTLPDSSFLPAAGGRGQAVAALVLLLLLLH